jgi:uncharacterized protein (DUF2062 family)
VADVRRWPARLRRAFYDLRVEGEGPVREAAALGLGMFIGCTPFYGAHLLICYIVGRLARLNRLKMIVASNISNPLFSPFLVLSELQIGAWLRRGAFHDLTLEAFRRMNPWAFGADVLLGSLVVGAVLGLLTAAVTYLTGRGRHADDEFADLRRRASDPYLEAGIVAWELARARVRSDPIYRLLASDGFVPGGTVIDMACGRALTLSVLASTAEPRTLLGVESNPRRAAIASRALGDRATIIVGDADCVPLPSADAVMLIDVLGSIPFQAQDALIAAATRALRPDGVLLLREVDASAGRIFSKMPRRSFRRTRAEWVDVLRRHAFTTEADASPVTTRSPGFLMRCVPVRQDATLDEAPDTPDGRPGPTAGIELAAEPHRTT